MFFPFVWVKFDILPLFFNGSSENQYTNFLHGGPFRRADNTICDQTFYILSWVIKFFKNVGAILQLTPAVPMVKQRRLPVELFDSFLFDGVVKTSIYCVVCPVATLNILHV